MAAEGTKAVPSEKGVPSVSKSSRSLIWKTLVKNYGSSLVEYTKTRELCENVQTNFKTLLVKSYEKMLEKNKLRYTAVRAALNCSSANAFSIKMYGIMFVEKK